ncbi:MAG: matrixin family metalloprotease [Pseudomonadota bacterium]
MSEPLEPVPSVRQPIATPKNVQNSLLSGAVAHTVKPSIEPESTAPKLSRKRKLSLKIIGLGALSAVLGLGGAAGISHLRARPALVMQIVSGNPALKKGSDGESVRWHANKNKLYLDASLDQLGAHAREAVQLGFGTWLGSGAKLPNLAFDSTKGAEFGKEPNGKSEIMYGPIKLPGHENDLALTVTFSDPKTGDVVEADMIFNSNHPYGLLPYQAAAGTMTPDDLTLCAQKYDLQSIATHEAGHFFGLGEDYDSTTATMFYTTGRCETNKRVLQGSDETTMDALYTTSSAQGDADAAVESAKGCGGARIGQGRTNGAPFALSLLGVLGFVAWRRRRAERAR